MAQVANPRKVFSFVVEIGGINQFEIQKVTIPETEIEKVEHGDTNHNIKTPGKVTVGDMVWEKVRPSPQGDKWAWLKLEAAQSLDSGGGALPSNVKETIIVKEMDASGNFALNRWLCTGCWVFKVSQNDFDRMSSDNQLESISWSVDKIKRL